MALGLTMQLPTDDKHSYTKEHLEGMLAVLMGGPYGGRNVSSAHHPPAPEMTFERATDIARNMVCEWGMSELGPLAFAKRKKRIFPRPRNCAASRLQRKPPPWTLDKEVKRIVNIAYESAKNIQNTHRDVLAHCAGTSGTRSAGRHRSAYADRRQAAAGKGADASTAAATGCASDRS